ncbi:hypothetical protein IQ07DRAFT_137246 [Pyrenochaeta sp. DS3sAY3a]|nr:hypothetical protein IQ07DRAFT_137246 [Pyrenochaeta sp. DS3sAY3a]
MEGIPLLASSPVNVLEAFLGKGIAPSLSGDKNLQELYDDESGIPEENSAWIQRGHVEFAPCIYVRELVNEDNHSPTPAQLLKVIRVLREYASGDDEFAAQNAEIERKSRHVHSDEDDIKNGHHIFFLGKWKRVQSLLTFCSALEQRLSEIEEKDIPVPWTLKYVGYAKCAAKRLYSYKKDNSQSWLSVPVRNATQYLFPDSLFELKTHVMFFCVFFEEKLLSRIGQAYYETGTGLGVVLGGVQVSSADLGNVAFKEASRMWNNTAKFRESVGVLEENLGQESQKSAAYQRYAAEEKAKEASEKKKWTREMRVMTREYQRDVNECGKEAESPTELSKLRGDEFIREAEALEKSLAC